MKNDVYVTKYVPPGTRTPTAEELLARGVIHGLKVPTKEAIDIAAPQMARFIEGPCWLVPVPASNGSLDANLALARAIAAFVDGARVKCAVRRSHPVESSEVRRQRRLRRLTVEEHAIVRVAGPMHTFQVFFVDNAITTGTTIAACRQALGWGVGLVYADASTLYRDPELRRPRHAPVPV